MNLGFVFKSITSQFEPTSFPENDTISKQNYLFIKKTPTNPWFTNSYAHIQFTHRRGGKLAMLSSQLDSLPPASSPCETRRDMNPALLSGGCWNLSPSAYQNLIPADPEDTLSVSCVCCGRPASPTPNASPPGDEHNKKASHQRCSSSTLSYLDIEREPIQFT